MPCCENGGWIINSRDLVEIEWDIQPTWYDIWVCIFECVKQWGVHTLWQFQIFWIGPIGVTMSNQWFWRYSFFSSKLKNKQTATSKWSECWTRSTPPLPVTNALEPDPVPAQPGLARFSSRNLCVWLFPNGFCLLEATDSSVYIESYIYIIHIYNTYIYIYVHRG